MAVKKITGSFLSTNKVNKVAFYIYKPQRKKAKGIVQISHGMCEYIERYEDFAIFMAEQGFVVCGNDHLGHGKLAEQTGDLGYFAPENGYRFMATDLLTLQKKMKKEYPNLPYFLFGHSMGSFVARLFMARFGDTVDGVILCGTGGIQKKSTLSGAKGLARGLKKKNGERYVSEMLKNMAFRTYNDSYLAPRTANDWLSRDEQVVDKYLQDPLCTFVFTASGFHDLFSLIETVSSPATIAKAPDNLPLFFIAGDDDPVGSYGKGVIDVANRYLDKGQTDVSVHIYPEARHEILNEINKEEVYEDVLKWIVSKL